MRSAIILGGARCVFEDAEQALEMFQPDVTIAVNDIASQWPGPVDHVVTLHPDKFAAKAIAAHPEAVVWSHVLKSGAHKQTKDWGGSSGLLAVKVAIVHLDLEKIVLAGVPMDIQPNFTREHKEWRQAKSYWRGWRRHNQDIAPYVRSMSGVTRQQLGEPTLQWLSERSN